MTIGNSTAPPEAPTSDLDPRPAAKLTQNTSRSYRSRNHEFLAATLETLETPRSPIASQFAIFVGTVLIAAVAWSYFGWLDIHAVAQGVVQPSGRAKSVQPVGRGRVIAIRVENGSIVTAGTELIKLDSTETLADLKVKTRDLEDSKAEVARRKAAIVSARRPDLQVASIDFEANTPAEVRSREEAILAADLTLLAATRASLEAQLSENLSTRERLTASLNSRANLIALARERVELRGGWKDGGFGSQALIIDAQQQLQIQLTTDAGDRGQLIETVAAISTLRRKGDETVAKFLAEQNQKLSEAERKQSRLLRDLVEAKIKNEHTIIAAPISGSVQQLAVTTIGQVVASGQSLMTIVPNDAPIEIEAKLENKDIGFVKVGQPAAVKIDAFPFTHYGTLKGTVVKISSDAIDSRDSTSTNRQGNSPGNGQGTNSARPSPTNYLAFSVVIVLDQRSIFVDGSEVPLSSGMGATVEIKTGKRRAIDFLLSPLREIASNAAHER